MKFWDTSAIVPLCLDEPHSSTVRDILSGDSAIVVWWATRTEYISALMRQVREGGLTTAGERQARHVLQALTKAWMEIQPSEALRGVAERLLGVHPLRAADAFQLAAALQWCERQTADKTVISFDARLRDAAHKEGFEVLPSEAR